MFSSRLVERTKMLLLHEKLTNTTLDASIIAP